MNKKPLQQTGEKPSAQLKEQTAHQILSLVQQLAQEQHQGNAELVELSLDSELDRAIGLDSLSRAELIRRIEEHFQLTLPPTAMAEFDTPEDLLKLVLTHANENQPPTELNIKAIKLQPLSSTPVKAQTLQQVLQWHVGNHPQRPHLFVYDNANQISEISYQQLSEQAHKIAAGLLQYHIEPGQSVAIMLPTCRQYFYVFFAILLLRAIPVPIYPPARASQIEDHLNRHATILGNAQARLLITVQEAKPLSRLLQMQIPSLEYIVLPEELEQHGERSGEMNGELNGVGTPQPDDIAFLQYTSGSTGTPKGVSLTHANLLANIRAMGQAVKADSSDVFVSWLPVYHDMGLIGAWFSSLYFAIPLVIMSPLLFLSKPERWLRAIAHHKGTLSPAPNFAYELCINKIRDEDLQDLDLSSWRIAWNGAEPVSANTIQRFTDRFGPYGFHSEAMSPVYGLAESSVGLVFPPLGREPIIDRIQRQPLALFGKAVPATNSPATIASGSEKPRSETLKPEEPAGVMENVALGYPLAGHQLRIIDDNNRELPDRQEGQVEFQGPSATRGYFNEPEKTAALFNGEWLKTGDRGYSVAGDLFITGRSKDIIIRAGRNIYPHELEEALSNIDGIRKGCVATFAVNDPHQGTEKLVIIAESRWQAPERQQQLQQTINTMALDLLGAPPDDIVIAPPHTVPKTSSGKIRRSACRDLYLSRELHAGRTAVWLQVSRLMFTGIKPQLTRFWQKFTDGLFAIYMWGIMAIIASGVWLAVVLIPVPKLCWKVTRLGGRLLAWFTRIPITIHHQQADPRQQPCIYVANHASYLDGLFCTIALADNPHFIAKAELLHNPFTRWFLNHLGCEFVERFDTHQGLEDASRIALKAKQQGSLFYFPEGTFLRGPGLLTFHMGAFTAAIQAQLPIVPISICGSRGILRGDELFPRHGAVSITISEPIYPGGDDWHAAVSLRDQARAEILRHIDEPDLADRPTPHP